MKVGGGGDRSEGSRSVTDLLCKQSGLFTQTKNNEYACIKTRETMKKLSKREGH